MDFSTSKKALLDNIKSQKWFYDFELPDGEHVDSYLPEHMRPIHVSRLNALDEFLRDMSTKSGNALDVGCHEGFFSKFLAQRFKRVVGMDRNKESLDKCRLIADFYDLRNLELIHANLEEYTPTESFDFVLCYGLLYHVENPIRILRQLAALTKKTLCIESQVMPYDFVGCIEDGSYLAPRDVHGLFALCADYSHSPEGGVTDIALVPSKNAIKYMLLALGFKSVDFYSPKREDYEQFTRNHRVILFASK